MFAVLKGKILQTRLLYPARISFKIDGEIKSFSDKQAKVKRIQYHQTSFTTNLKGTYIVKKYKKRKKIYKINPKQENSIGTYISIITLNINGLNAPTKRHRLAEWIPKQDPYLCCIQETHFRPNIQTKVRGWKNIFHANGRQKKAGIAILISDQIDLKIKKITRDKEGHYIMIKESIQEEDITIVNIYAPNIAVPQYIRQTVTDIKGETDSNTIILGDFNTLLIPMDRSLKRKLIRKRVKWYIRWDGAYWYLQDIPSKCRRIHLLKFTRTILQDRPHHGSEIKP